MPSCYQAQGFGQNYNPSYHAGGLIGHTGIDEHCGYGTPVHAVFDGIAYKVLTPEHPANDGSGFTGVFQIVDDDIECFEWLTGHLTPSVSEGAPIQKKVDVIGTEANHGQVWSGNRQITVAEQLAGNHEGAHRHYQKRPVIPVSRTDPYHMYLTGPGNGPYYASGFYYQFFDSNNGFNGCVNPLMPTFYRDLTIGSTGYDVFVLQRILKRNGFFALEPTGNFGAFTAASVGRYQAGVMGISPTSYFGPKTRARALQETSPLPVLSGQ